MTIGDYSIQIKPPSAFSYDRTVDYLSRSDKECMFLVEDRMVTRLITTSSGPVLIRLSSLVDGGINLEFPSRAADDSDLTEDIRTEAAAYVRDWFDLDRDLAPFFELAEQDDLLRECASRFYGLRLVGIDDLFEAMCWGIMGQQINLPFAYTLKRRFVEEYGAYQDYEGKRYFTFPTPDTIARLSLEDLTPMQLTTRKAEYLIGTAKEMVEGRLSKEQLLALGDLAKIEKALTSIRGIGPWTANYVLMRCLRVPAAFPIADVGLHNALKLLLDRADKPSIAEIKELSAGWGDWKAYATFYLWRLLY
ncbi:DNA-3-methyladenine glycosylase [Paenibacillus sp. OV219]|uniref:DNA-3-methyladenine glycosylase family protein n=1 Tax=Paenibacillus sp. OV219 TaxID=1884377 RepID=UPI0008D0B26B|nr:DNA-3-methyladenine glycosylase [Paenibacillus sp. OV219]SEM87982.1 DNA-3-methyladenine glycosylase II [Paenibacillus sp. OV219]